MRRYPFEEIPRHGLACVESRNEILGDVDRRAREARHVFLRVTAKHRCDPGGHTRADASVAALDLVELRAVHPEFHSNFFLRETEAGPPRLDQVAILRHVT